MQTKLLIQVLLPLVMVVPARGDERPPVYSGRLEASNVASVVVGTFGEHLWGEGPAEQAEERGVTIVPYFTVTEPTVIAALVTSLGALRREDDVGLRYRTFAVLSNQWFLDKNGNLLLAVQIEIDRSTILADNDQATFRHEGTLYLTPDQGRMLALSVRRPAYTHTVLELMRGHCPQVVAKLEEYCLDEATTLEEYLFPETKE